MGGINLEYRNFPLPDDLAVIFLLDRLKTKESSRTFMHLLDCNSERVLVRLFIRHSADLPNPTLAATRGKLTYAVLTFQDKSNGCGRACIRWKVARQSG